MHHNKMLGQYGKIVFLFYIEEAKNGLKKTEIVIVFYSEEAENGLKKTKIVILFYIEEAENVLMKMHHNASLAW